VLRLVQRRRARTPEFGRLLHEVVEALEGMPAGEQERWHLFLSYIHALVYHERQEGEIDDMQEVIEASASTETHRREIQAMKQTYAEKLLAEGQEKGELLALRKTLLQLLRQRFRKVPASIETTVNNTSDVGQLETWIGRVVTASTLSDIGIPGNGKGSYGKDA
jgi:hypothetical protein